MTSPYIETYGITEQEYEEVQTQYESKKESQTMTTNTSNAYKSRYGAKEYHGDRPCIDPLTMAELRLRLYGEPAHKQSWLYNLGRRLWGALKP